ncbi:putative transcription factor interactor and regulator CCHC(Zn) family [Helianthus anomalus]
MTSSGPRHPPLTRQEKRDRRFAAIIAKSVAKAVSDVYENGSKSSEGAHADPPKDSSKAAFSFKQFKACGPKEFTGEDGPTTMFHWFDSIEVTLRQSGCPENLRTLNATGTPEQAIKKYIRALPDCVADFVHASKPATIKATYLLAAEINDKRVKAGFWDKQVKSLHQATVSSASESTAPSKMKNKRKNCSSKNCSITAAPQQAVPAPVARVASAPPAKRAYTGPHPACPICSYHHPVGVACRYCAHCQVYNHYTAQCRYGPRQAPVQAVINQALLPAPQGQPAAQAPVVNARVCYNCGDPNHFANRCPNRVVKQEPQQQQQHQPQQQQQAARARTFNINVNQAQADNNVVNGTFLVNGIYASCLFDTGADNCFVSFEFEKLLSRKRSYLSSSFEVEVATGKSIVVNYVLRDCTLELNNHIFPINLIPLQLGSFDVIVGMDFLRENHAEVVCFDKMIRFSLANGDQLCVYGETASKGLKLMSCLQASKYLRKEYQAFLANIVVAEKEKKRKVEVKDVPVV